MTKKNQILVLTDFSEATRYAVQHAALLSKIFNADLNILFVKENYSGNISENISNIRNELHEYSTDISNEFFIKVFYFALEGKLKDTIFQIAKKIDAIFLIVGFNKVLTNNQYNLKTVHEIIKSSYHPVLVVKNKLEEENLYKNIVLPVKSNMENKEKVSWANFFGKFNNSKITLVSVKTKKQAQKQKAELKLNDTVEHLERNKTNYVIHSTNFKNKVIDFESLKLSQSIEADLCLFLIKKKQTPLNDIFQSNEMKMLNSKIKTTLMFIHSENE